MSKSVYDVAVLLETIAGFDERDNATFEAVDHIQTNYTQYLSSSYADFSNFKLGVRFTPYVCHPF
jgi:Asp-tRNA(Asn)/Glu-tRNA(Gln) amidotransferase A subunit family amidase